VSEKRSFENCGVLPPSDPATAEIDHIHEGGARCTGEKDFCPLGSSRDISRKSNRKSPQNNYLDTKYICYFK
jgi:hypothetical protein